MLLALGEVVSVVFTDKNRQHVCHTSKNVKEYVAFLSQLQSVCVCVRAHA